MVYYKNSPLVRSTGSAIVSEVRVLSRDEVNHLVLERKITPVSEIRYEKRSGRVSRPRNWVNYER